MQAKHYSSDLENKGLATKYIYISQKNKNKSRGTHLRKLFSILDKMKGSLKVKTSLNSLS